MANRICGEDDLMITPLFDNLEILQFRAFNYSKIAMNGNENR